MGPRWTITTALLPRITSAREITDPAITLIATTFWTSDGKAAQCGTEGWLVLLEGDWCCGRMTSVAGG